jgi:hypothetical protein
MKAERGRKEGRRRTSLFLLFLHLDDHRLLHFDDGLGGSACPIASDDGSAKSIMSSGGEEGRKMETHPFTSQKE